MQDNPSVLWYCYQWGPTNRVMGQGSIKVCLTFSLRKVDFHCHVTFLCVLRA